MDKKQRRINFPGVMAASSLLYGSIPREERAVFRKCYVDGIVPEKSLHGLVNFGLFDKLLCEPLADRSEWARWKETFRDGEIGSLVSSFLELQRSSLIYFGDNTVFAGREEEIFDYFVLDQDWSEKNYPPPDDILQLASRVFGGTLPHVARMEINPYCQYWRSFEISRPWLQFHRDAQLSLDPVMSKRFASIVCPFAWALNREEYADSTERQVAQRVMTFLQDPTVNDSFREHCLSVIEELTDDFGAATGAGGTVSVCIKFESDAQVDGAIGLLNPYTRYPYTIGERGTALAMPPWNAQFSRRSVQTLLKLAETGFRANRHRVLDDRVLYFEFTMPLVRSFATSSMEALTRDSSRLEEQVRSRRIDEEDKIGAKSPPAFDAVFLIEPLEGARELGFVEDGCSWIGSREGVGASFEDLTGGTRSPEEYLPDVLKWRFAELKKAADSLPPWRDGFAFF